MIRPSRQTKKKLTRRELLTELINIAFGWLCLILMGGVMGYMVGVWITKG